MNRIYRSIWSDALGTWIAVSELAKGKHKTSVGADSSAIKIAPTLLATGLLSLSSSVYALPTGHELVAGQATVNHPAVNQMQINQASDRAVINWQSFSVGQNEAVHIQQPNQQAALLNRVVGQDASQIQGKIQANGQVYLTNPNGVVFSKTAQVDVGGLVATTHDINNDDFIAGKNHFSQSKTGTKVENHGTINTTDGGVVALIGESVTNTGTINTPKGTTALAAGKTVDLDMKGDGLVEVKVTEAALNAQIENHGAITADGGRVVLSAKSANALMDTVINQNGIVKAQGLIERNGEIILDGGDNGAVKISGTLDTTPVHPELVEGQSGQPANIQIKGNTIELTSTSMVNASGNTKGGNIQIGDKQSTQSVTLKQDSTVKANAENGDAGHINVLAKMDTGKVDVQGNVQAQATKKGNGGFIDTSAAKVKVADTANINTQSKDGKSGSWLIDPYDFTIGTDITGAALSTALNTNSVTIQTGASSATCTNAACGTGNSSGNGDIFVNDVVNWSNNTLTLNAYRNININKNLNGSGTAKLVLLYGQSSATGGTNDDYFVNAQVNLAAGQNFNTQKGTLGANLAYTVITDLGVAGDASSITLQGMKNNLSGLYALGSNIDASSTSGWNAGVGFLPVGNRTTPFSGQLAGLGHTITGLWINRSTTDDVGLFGALQTASIKNIGLENFNIVGRNGVGSLTGWEIVGTGSTVKNVYATGNVSGDWQVGGLAGLSRSFINNSYADVNVTGLHDDVGGLVGQNSGNISNAYATGSVSSSGYKGGLLGTNYAGNVSNVYATGLVSGTGVSGGLVGIVFGGAISNSFSDVKTTGQTNAVGALSGGTASNVFGKTTTDLMTQSTYTSAGWDFSNTWWMVDGNTRPFLRMEYNTDITNNHQLQMMAMNLGANYTLANNLNLTADLVNASSMWNVSKGFLPIGASPSTAFTGQFDGLGHTITGLMINRSSDNVGLFGYTLNANIRNIGMVGGSIKGSSYVGGLVGWNSCSTINNAYTTGNVSGSGNIGGLVGVNDANSTINNAYTTGNISVSGVTVGGLVGYNRNSTINNTYATGNVNGPNVVGGLLGVNDNGVINNSFWDTQTTNIGVGINNGTLNNILGKTSTQMKQLATFTSWDISSTGGSSAIWRIYEGNTNPLLRNFMTGLVLNDAPDLTNTYNGITKTAGTTSIVDSLLLGSAATGKDVGFYNGYYSTQQGYDITGGNLQITPASLTVTPDNITKTYGQIATLTYNVTGLQNNEAIGNVTLGSSGNTATANVAGSPHNINILNISGGTFNPSNYDIIYQVGKLTITPANLTIIANAASKTYGQTLSFSGTEFSSTGLQNGETIGTVSLHSDGVYANAPVNDSLYAIIASNAKGGTFDADNYNITYQDGELTVNPALLIIQANDDFKIYDGKPYNGGNGLTYWGFVNNENSSVLTGKIIYGGDSQGAIDAGRYNISASGLNADNYHIKYSDGTLIIGSNNTGSIKDNISGVVTSVYAPSITVTNPSNNTFSTDNSIIIVKDNDTSNNTSSSSNNSSRSNDSNNQFFGFVFEDKNTNQTIVPALSIKNSAGRVKRLKLSADRQFLTLLLEDGSVRVWDFQNGVQRTILTSSDKKNITDVGEVNRDGEFLPVSSNDGIQVYDIIGALHNDKLFIKENDVQQFISSDDASLILVSSSDALSLWNHKANLEYWHHPYTRGNINKLAFSQNKHLIAVLSQQRGVYEYDAKEGTANPLTDAIDIIDSETGNIIKSLPNFGENIVFLRFKNDNTLQLGLASGQLLNWNIQTDDKHSETQFSDTLFDVDYQQNIYAYMTKNNIVRVSNLQGEAQLSIQNPNNPIQDAKLVANGKKLLTVLANGDLTLWDIATGKKQLRLFSTTQEEQQGWTVMDNFGRFDGSDDAIENFNWVADDEEIPLDSFSENYYEPGLLANILQNQDNIDQLPTTVLDGINLPPKVNVQLSEQQDKDEKISIQLDVYDRGGGIDKLNVYHNGKLINYQDYLVSQQNKQEGDNEHRNLVLNISPSSGKNIIKVTASNSMGIENNSSEISFDGKTKAYISSVRLMTVGINDYSDKTMKLNYSVADAELIEQTLKNNSKKILSKQLLNEEATKPNILAKLKELSLNAHQQDVLVIYFAGHGMAVGKEWYFLPYETKYLPSEEQMAKTGITATELSEIFKNSKIQHIMLMVDACYSGASMEAFNKLQNSQRYLSRSLGRSLGITVIAATTKNQEAFELKSIGHGLFTYLLSEEIIKKEADKALTAHSMAEQISKLLPKYSKAIVGKAQEPTSYTKGNDFMLMDLTTNKD